MSRHSASEYRSCRVPPSKATGSHHTRDCPRPTDQLTKLLTSWLVVAQQCFEAEALFPTGMLWYVPDRNAHKCVCFRVCVCVCLGFPRFDPWLGKIQEKDMVAHFCILTRTIPWTEELGGLRSMGSHTAGHDSVTEHVCIFRGIHLDSFAIRNGIYFLIYFHKLCSAFQN